MRTYLLWYKGGDRLTDRLIRRFDGGNYSHVEIAIRGVDGKSWRVISASKRDNHQVRVRTLTPNPDHWDLMVLDEDFPMEPFLKAATKLGQSYDTLGAVLSITPLGRKRNKTDSTHCSALVGYALGIPEYWRLSVRELEYEIQHRFDARMLG